MDTMDADVCQLLTDVAVATICSSRYFVRHFISASTTSDLNTTLYTLFLDRSIRCPRRSNGQTILSKMYGCL